jgi:hypothetical protein
MCADAAREKINCETFRAAKRFLPEALEQGENIMKKLILGTIAAATIIGSAGIASAQVRQDRNERNWFNLSALSAQQNNQSHSPNMNFAPDSVK